MSLDVQLRAWMAVALPFALVLLSFVNIARNPIGAVNFAMVVGQPSLVAQLAWRVRLEAPGRAMHRALDECVPSCRHCGIVRALYWVMFGRDAAAMLPPPDSAPPTRPLNMWWTLVESGEMRYLPGVATCLPHDADLAHKFAAQHAVSHPTAAHHATAEQHPPSAVQQQQEQPAARSVSQSTDDQRSVHDAQ